MLSLFRKVKQGGQTEAMKKKAAKPRVKTENILVEMLGLVILISLAVYAISTGKIF